jgi:uncharacterized delta-60 repeat protein
VLALLVLLCLLALAPQAHAAAGLPDPTFGGDGFTVLDEPALANEELNDVVVMPDGRILGGGAAGGSSGFLLARFNADGSPDGSFGSGGIRVEPDTGLEGDPRGISGLELLPEGNVAAAGLGRGPANAFMFARYLSTGTLDPAFGDGGLTMVPITPSGTARAIAAGPDGKLVAAGDGTADKAVVVRVTQNGLPDETFNPAPKGVRFVDVPLSSSEEADAARVLASGAVLIGGHASNGGFLAELDVNGNPVAGFGTAGIAVHNLGTNTAPSGSIDDLQVQPDGRILAAGTSVAGPGDVQGFVARFTSNGELDPSFAGDGVFQANPTPGTDEAHALELLPDGRILAGGTRNWTEFDSGDSWLLRLTADGQLDAGFGSGGEAVGSAVPGTEQAFGLALQPDGRAVVAGRAEVPGGGELMVGRFTADEPPLPAGAIRKQAPNPRCGGRTATVVGSGKADKLKGTKRADVIAGLGGNDKVSSLAGNDIVCGGGGKDTIVLGKGKDEGRGEKGADVIKGGPGKDRLLGATGRDKLLGGPGPDLCNGGGGRDAKATGCEQRKKLP